MKRGEEKGREGEREKQRTTGSRSSNNNSEAPCSCSACSHGLHIAGPRQDVCSVKNNANEISGFKKLGTQRDLNSHFNVALSIACAELTNK